MDLIKLCDDDILNYVAPNGKKIASRCVKSVLINHGYYDYIMNRYSDNSRNKISEESKYISETLYRMIYELETIPKCKICGKPLVYTYTNYPNYCSRTCSNHDEEVIKRISDSCSKSIKQAYKRDGDNIKNKRKETLSKNYNVDIDSSSPFAVEQIQKYANEQVKEIYGVDNSFQLDWVREQRIKSQRLSSIELQKSRGIDIEYLEDGRYLVKNCCPIHGDLIYTQMEFNRRFGKRRFYSEPCYMCNPFKYIGKSGQEVKIIDIVKSVYDGEIITNSKSILDEHREIDIYLPELKLGFEFQGDYWHMNPIKYRFHEINPSNNMLALDKWREDRHKLFLAEQKGIILYQIWENELINNYDNVVDIINKLILNQIQYIHPLIKLKRELDKIGSYKIIDDLIFEFGTCSIIYLDESYFSKTDIEQIYKNKFKEGKNLLYITMKDIMCDNKLHQKII